MINPVQIADGAICDQGCPARIVLPTKALLSAPKLEAMARGWTPAPKDTTQWREFRVISTEQGGNTVNCYLVWDEVSRDAALFDTGWTAEPIFKIIEEKKWDGTPEDEARHDVTDEMAAYKLAGVPFLPDNIHKRETA